MRRVTALAIVLCSLHCGGSDKQEPAAPAKVMAAEPEADPQPAGPGLRVTVVPDHAEVVLDGEPIGPASKLPAVVALESGLHQIMIRADGYRTWRAEVAVRDAVETIDVTLEASTD